jgi:hypothetical protein
MPKKSKVRILKEAAELIVEAAMQKRKESNHWELYSSIPEHGAVNKELDAAWEHAKKLKPEFAISHMHNVMSKHRKLGAMDSEPLSFLAKKVQSHFGEQYYKKARGWKS